MDKSMDTFDKRAAAVKKTVEKYDGKMPKKASADKGLLSAEDVKTNILNDMQSAVRQADALRKGSQDERSIDLSLPQFVKMKFGFGSLDSFYQSLGINPSHHSMENLSTMVDFPEGYKWLRPEIVREAIRLGLRRNPIYGSLIAAEETVTQRKITMPQVNMSAADVERVNEAETIPVGSISFMERDVKINKLGTGFKVSDEVQKYVSLNVLSLYLQDVGVRLGLGLDTMAVDTLVNGGIDDGSYAAPVIGVQDAAKGIQYEDLLRTWIRMGRLGRTPSALLSNEDPAIKILQFDEFKGSNYRDTKQNINIKTPIPQNQDYLIHGAMPDAEQLGFIDNNTSLIKLNASALTVESERIAEKQLNGTYVTVTTGFAKLFRDSFVILDATQEYENAPFPDWMDVSAAEKVVIS